MVKKTLLSLAIAVSTAGLTACNLSSTADNNDVLTSPILAGQPGQPGTDSTPTMPIFSAGSGTLPIQIDILFAEASTTDGTADTSDIAPPVTTAINDLAGFSATSSIDIAFNAPLAEASVIAGHSIWLIELKSKEDNSLIDSLDLASIVSSEANPFVSGLGAPGGDQLNPGLDYVAEYVEMDNGATPTIRIHPLKPLDPKTKYVVVVTDKLKDSNGDTVQPSFETNYMLGEDILVSNSLVPVRTAVRAWNGLAQAFLAQAAPGTGVVLSYTFTTEANDDILLAMAAPETYISGLLNDTKTLEGLLGADTVALLVAGTAQALNAANTAAATEGWVNIDPSTTAGTLAARNTPQYKALVTSKVAQSIIGPGAAQQAGAALAGGGSGAAQVNGAFAAWNDTEGNEAKQIPANPADWTAVHYDYIARALGQYSDATDSATYIALASNGAGVLLKDAAHRPSAQDFIAIPNVVITHSALGLPNLDAASMQGMLTLPQFMKTKSLADADSFSDFWKGSTAVGAVIDAAFGNDAGTTPPKDSDGSLNVTYRFPFAQYVEDVKVPVLVTYPLDDGEGNDSENCGKPDTGWKTIIFQHGITTDRTSSLGFANSMSAPGICFATVAMDLPTHGVDASSSDRNGSAQRYAAFNGFNVAGYVLPPIDPNDAATTPTPFAATLAGLEANEVTTFAGLAERHGNIALNAQQQPTPMVFTADSESGNSGDFFINLTNMQQTRDHLRQATMDMMNLTASISGFDLDGAGSNFAAGDLDEDNLYFVGHSLGAITGLTSVAVNNTIANSAAISEKEVKPFKAAVFANPGGQLPKLLENSPSFSARILPGLASKGLTQGTASLEKFFSVFQAPLDSADPVNFTALLKGTDTPILMFEMVGGGLVNATDSNLDADLGKVSGLPDTLIVAGGYPADTVVPNNANPALDDVATGLSYLAGTDPLINQLELATVTASVWPPGTENLMVVSKLKEGTHGTISSADAYTVFAEMIGQTASFFQTTGKGLVVGDANQLQVPAAE
jgi:hypothetical protein